MGLLSSYVFAWSPLYGKYEGVRLASMVVVRFEVVNGEHRGL